MIGVDRIRHVLGGERGFCLHQVAHEPHRNLALDSDA
jgi:hypothetical protein